MNGLKRASNTRLIQNILSPPPPKKKPRVENVVWILKFVFETETVQPSSAQINNSTIETWRDSKNLARWQK